MLTQQDRAILELEQAYPRLTGKKQDAIRHELDLTLTRYQQRLRWLVTQPEAVSAYPMVCARVQRVHQRKADERAALMEMIRNAG